MLADDEVVLTGDIDICDGESARKVVPKASAIGVGCEMRDFLSSFDGVRGRADDGPVFCFNTAKLLRRESFLPLLLGDPPPGRAENDEGGGELMGVDAPD